MPQHKAPEDLLKVKLLYKNDEIFPKIRLLGIDSQSSVENNSNISDK
jgi:hypothetical protein